MSTLLCWQVIASCGYWDNSIRCYSSEEGRLLQSIRQHKDIVTCIEAGSDGRTLATGELLSPHLLCSRYVWACGIMRRSQISLRTPVLAVGHGKRSSQNQRE